MAGFTRPLKKRLTEAGCHQIPKRGKCDHEIWYSPITKTTFPVDGNIESRHTANKTLKDAGLEKAF